MMTRSTNQTISLYSEFSSREELLAFANAVDESWDRHKPIKSKPEKRNPRKNRGNSGPRAIRANTIIAKPRTMNPYDPDDVLASSGSLPVDDFMFNGLFIR